MGNPLIVTIIKNDWITESSEGISVSVEIDNALFRLYQKIDQNESWKESFKRAFGDPAKPIQDVSDFVEFNHIFALGMRGFLPKELCDEIEYWCVENDTPLGKIIGVDNWLCRYQVVPVALYNHFIVGNRRR